MALPLLRWSCRRPSVGLSAYLRFNKLSKIRNHSLVKNQASLGCVVSGVRFCSSDGDGHRHTRKVVVLGIPNPFIWFRTKFSFFLIRAYFDKDFSIEEFTDGAKQAFAHVSRLLSQCQFKELEGLVTKDVIGKLEEKCADLPLSYKRALLADPDDIMYTTPADVGFCYEDDGRKFVSILMRFWYLTSAQLPEETMEGVRLFQVALGKNGEKPTSKRLLSANYEFQREFTQGVTPDWTITRIEHSKLLD
ncbi:m-AAA protease-interacting protein 1, mitochondrial [Clarias gariepinus]|uniref:m-AAA protease-interacting protein 1, mitochondrial n=1 Tax=Clarias gariepinus TaxID=13013 RepID=UPI00234C7D1D|nr:m-AAA protease-interacting protein 1, mitochondrial [Clarias gariepinus]